MPYEEEEDRVCEVKCPKGGGVCGIGATPILLPIKILTHLSQTSVELDLEVVRSLRKFGVRRE